MDEIFMKRALELAQKGWGKTNPNPLVGAVIVRDGTVVGEGAHLAVGSHHAEVNALREAGEKAKGSTVYVTLEPCSHYGRTPPCAKALIDAGVSRVVAAMEDPNPKVAGRGFGMLKEAGIQVKVGVMEEEAKVLNEIFIKYVTERLPFVILKTAMSLDGKIAAHTGDSKWITREKSREYVHRIRDRVAAIMVGVNTVKIDNPYLTTRIRDKAVSNPVRVIIDTRGEIPLNSNVLDIGEDSKAIIATTEFMTVEKENILLEKGARVIRTTAKDGRVDLKELMVKLYQTEIDSVLLEGGSTLNASAISEGIVDKVMFFIAPKVIGGIDAPGPIGGNGVDRVEAAWDIRDISINRFDDDILIEGYLNRR